MVPVCAGAEIAIQNTIDASSSPATTVERRLLTKPNPFKVSSRIFLHILEPGQASEVACRSSVGVDFEIDIDLGAVVKLADGLGVALVPAVLGVDFVVD